MKDFLLFAKEHGGYTFEQTLDLFLAEVGGRVGTKPWQLQQASDAIRVYRYQFRGAKDDGEGGTPSGGLNDEASSLVRLREVIRLRHYAKSTEKTYLHWNRRFLAYHRETSTEGEPSAADAKAFLTHLAMVEKVSASTQNQAFSALLLLFREVLRIDLEEMAQTVRAKRRPKAATAAGRAQQTTTGSAATPSIFVPPPRSADSMTCPPGARRWRFPRRRFSPMGPATRWRTLTTQIRVNAKLKVYH